MRVIGLFLVLVSFSVVAFGQMLDDGENYSPKKGEASDPLYGNRPAHTMSQREFSQLFERQVVQPSLEDGFLTGAIALDPQTGEISICEKAPEPSSLSLLGLGALVMLFMKRKRSWWVGALSDSMEEKIFPHSPEKSLVSPLKKFPLRQRN